MSDVRFAFRKLHQSPAFSSIAGIKLVLGIGLHTAIFSLTGIRMALGAQTSDVLRLIVSQGMKPVLVGLAIGVLATFVALIAAQLYHVSAQNPALFACLLPAVGPLWSIQSKLCAPIRTYAQPSLRTPHSG
jgi:hypothetical protein